MGKFMKIDNDRLLKNCFLLFIVTVNILLTYFLYYSRGVLERYYQKPLPLITEISFNLCFWPIVAIALYFIKLNKKQHGVPERYFMLIISIEFVLLLIYFIAYVYPIVFCSRAILLN